jgi:hypothetical protein
MLTLLIVFLVLAAMCGVTWWIEEGPSKFAMPVPILPPQKKRFVAHTKAGYKPSRKAWVK